jgi:hypothetical protein
VGDVYDVSPNLAILLIAAGWARGETREATRRAIEIEPPDEDRRHDADRRHQETSGAPAH